MIQLSESAQAHFRRLIEREALPGLGVACPPCMPARPAPTCASNSPNPAISAARNGPSIAMASPCGSIRRVRRSSTLQRSTTAAATGGRCRSARRRSRARAPADTASLVERVRWVVEHEVNPQLAQHRGHVSVQEVTADGVVLLRFGGGCHGCGMADVTLKQGIESTLMTRVPGVTAVRDATDHATGTAPYLPRGRRPEQVTGPCSQRRGRHRSPRRNGAG
jgi:Fe/S biogenesis protein NfuA